jgi:transcriptional regulator with XRE-family HTH domain
MPAAASTGPGRREPLRRLLLRSALGDVLRRVRLGQRRTLADVAAAARVSVPYLSEVERGRKEVSSEVLAAIADALGIRLSEVLSQVGRDLEADRAEHARLERLDAARELRRRVTSARTPGRGDVLCLAA